MTISLQFNDLLSPTEPLEFPSVLVHRLRCFTTVTFPKADQSLLSVNVSPSQPEWEPSWHESPPPAPHWTDSAGRQRQQDGAPLKRTVNKTLGSGPNRRLGRLAEKKHTHTRLYKINSTYTYGVISQDVQLLHQLTDGDLLGSREKVRRSCHEWDSRYIVFRFAQLLQSFSCDQPGTQLRSRWLVITITAVVGRCLAVAGMSQTGWVTVARQIIWRLT